MARFKADGVVSVQVEAWFHANENISESEAEDLGGDALWKVFRAWMSEMERPAADQNREILKLVGEIETHVGMVYDENDEQVF